MTKNYKKALLTLIFLMTLNSCKDVYEEGIIRAKIGNKIFLRPVDDTTRVFRVIDFSKSAGSVQDKFSKNLYLNCKVGDTLLLYNPDKVGDLVGTYNKERTGIFGEGRPKTVSDIVRINGRYINRIDALEDLVEKQRQDSISHTVKEKYMREQQINQR